MAEAIGFVLLAYTLSAVPEAWSLLHAGAPASNVPVYVRMWCPGLAAFACIALLRLPLADLGLRRAGWRLLPLAYLLPLGYLALVYGATWLLSPGSLDTTALIGSIRRVPAVAERLGLPIGVLLVIWRATVGVGFSFLTAVGEEIGWRGFLMPRLDRLLGFHKACLATGLVWAVWHFPPVLWIEPATGVDPALRLVLFTAFIVPFSYLFGWLRLRTGSVWPCALLHASHNLFLHGLCEPMTALDGMARYATTEFGFGLPIAVTLTAIVLLRFPRRPDLRPETPPAGMPAAA